MIWDHAIATGAVLVTKDEDVITMRALSPEDAPAVIWVRIGNVTKRALIGRFSAALPAMVAALERGETVIQLSE
jgi:predicted nuclease of predicted toxin-antitoxin system